MKYETIRLQIYINHKTKKNSIKSSMTLSTIRIPAKRFSLSKRGWSTFQVIANRQQENAWRAKLLASPHVTQDPVTGEFTIISVSQRSARMQIIS
jgi:hypothetical protein